MEHTSSVISWGVVQLILVSSLAVFAKDDGFITATDDEKGPVKVETADDKEKESKEKKKNEHIPPKPTKEDIENRSRERLRCRVIKRGRLKNLR